MANPYFRFKQFTVYHDRCAMKVGTDGVLLGAWTDTTNTRNALDVGVGSGLITLMLAQRSAGMFGVDAIDIDKDAILQACDNISNSPFDSIKCIESSLQDYAVSAKIKYDLIVSNPPYFINSLLPDNSQRALARHTNSLSIDDFFGSVNKLLSAHGKLSLIFPFQDKELLISKASDNDLFPSRITNVHTTPQADPKRVLMEFSFSEGQIIEDSLIIEKARHVYSDAFVELVKDFYLNL